MPHQPRKFFKFVCLLLSFCFLFEQTGLAQVASSLDIAGKLTLLHRSLTADKFRPLHLRSLQFDQTNNNFKVLLDKGALKNPRIKELENASKDLMNYFFIGLALPSENFWVNLRPDSPDNIIDPRLATTDIGRILLEADVELKKDTAKATSPQTPLGRQYWEKLYKKAGELFGSDNVTIPTLTRPWIVPDEIIIREATDSAYVYKATLKVMLEQDYLNKSQITNSKSQTIYNSEITNSNQYDFSDPRLKQLNEYSSQLIREMIIPQLTKEVNTSKKYAPLRQVYYSLILAQWFKSRFKDKRTKYSQLIESHNLTNLSTKQPYAVNTYFQQYQASFKNGEYNISEPLQTPAGQVIRSYFSGGISGLAPANIPTAGSLPFVDRQTGARITVLQAIDRIATAQNPYLLAADILETSPDQRGVVLEKLVVRITDNQLSPQEVQDRVKAIEDAHKVESGRQLGARNTADGTYEKYEGEDAGNKAYTAPGIRTKAQTLRKAGFGQEQRFNLIKYGLAGNTGKSIVKDLAANPQKLAELRTKFLRLHEQIITEVSRQHQQRGGADVFTDFVFTRDYSLGAQGAVKLKIFELLAKGFSERDITGFITRDFLPALREEQMGALLPVGTEVEIWDKAPYTDAAFYPRSTVVDIWGGILGLPFGRDELVEFALPPSLSGNSQVAMIDSMVELGLIPQGWFSLHISGALPLKANHQHLLDQLASYLEMTKAILYTSDERIDYFADRWNPLDVKGGSGNVSKTQGKKPAFAIYADEDEVTRLEYRSGDVVVPGLAYQGAIPFIQNTHSLMFLALVAAIDSGSIKNKFMEDLLVAFDTFISDIDAWAELIKDTHPQLKALFGGNLFANVRAIKDIIQLRKASPELIEALRAIVMSLQERLRVILANAQRTNDLPADTKRIDNLEIIKRLRRMVPKVEDIKNIFMDLPMRNIGLNNLGNIDYNGITDRNPRSDSPSNNAGPNGNDYRDDIRRWLNDPRNFYNISPINRESYYIKSTSLDFTRFEIPQINLQLSNFQINPEDLIIVPRQPRGFLARLWGRAQAVLMAVHNWLIPFLVPLFPGINLFPGLFDMKGVQTKFQQKFWDALKDNERVARQNNFDMDSPVARRAFINQALRDILSGLPADRVESLRQDFWNAADLIMRLPGGNQKQAFNFALNIINRKMQNPPASPGGGRNADGTPTGNSPSISSTGFGNEEEANRNILKGIRTIAARQGLSMPSGGDVDLGVDNQDVFMVNGVKVIVIDAPYLSVDEQGEEQVASAGLRRGTVYATRTEFQRWQTQGITQQKVKHEQDEVEYLRIKGREMFGSDDTVALEMMSRFLKNPNNTREAAQLIRQAHEYARSKEDQGNTIKDRLKAITTVNPEMIAVERNAFIAAIVQKGGSAHVRRMARLILDMSAESGNEVVQNEAFREAVLDFITAENGDVLRRAVKETTGREAGLLNIKSMQAGIKFPETQPAFQQQIQHGQVDAVIIVEMANGAQVVLNLRTSLRYGRDLQAQLSVSDLSGIPDGRKGIVNSERINFISGPFKLEDGEIVRYGLSPSGRYCERVLLKGYTRGMYRVANELGGFVNRARSKLLTRLVWSRMQELPEEARILDFAAGEGRDLYLFDPAGQTQVALPESLARRIIATDFMPAALAKIKGRYPSMQVLKADWGAIPLDDGSVDLVFGLNGISYVPSSEIDKVIATLDRLLKPDKDGAKSMIFVTDVPPKRSQFYSSEILQPEIYSDVSQQLARQREFEREWIEALRSAFARRGYQLTVETITEKVESAAQPTHQRAAPYNLFDFGLNGFIQDSDPVLASGMVREQVTVLVIRAVSQSSSSGAQVKQPSESAVGSQVGAGKMGGIDFRNLPIVTQAVSNLRAPVGTANMGALQRMDLSQEWNQIEQMVAGGITPSGERIKEFVQASCVQGSVERDVGKVVSCIADILRQHEELCCSTDATLKDILVVLEATSSQSALTQALL